jgi:hypothetical protein
LPTASLGVFASICLFFKNKIRLFRKASKEYIENGLVDYNEHPNTIAIEQEFLGKYELYQRELVDYGVYNCLSEKLISYCRKEVCLIKIKHQKLVGGSVSCDTIKKLLFGAELQKIHKEIVKALEVEMKKHDLFLIVQFIICYILSFIKSIFIWRRNY